MQSTNLCKNYVNNDIAEVMASIEKIKNNEVALNLELSEACRHGYIGLVILLVENGATDFNRGLANACYGGHIDVINLMIAYGATYFDNGLANACYGGHVDVVNLMIKYGVTNFNDGLFGACIFNHFEVVKLMVKLGASDFDECYLLNRVGINDFLKAEQKLHDPRFVTGIRFIRRIMRHKWADPIIRHFIDSFQFIKHVANYYRQPDGRLYVKHKQNFEAKKK